MFCGIIGLGAFVFAAVSSSSESSKSTFRDGVNGFIDGWESSGARGSVELPDSIINASANDYAMTNPEK